VKLLVVAGEASGDLHAAAAVRALQALAPGTECFGMGGARLAAAGLESLYDAQSISVMGITEVLGKIPHVFSVIDGLARAAEERKPDVALLVDLPDFNLRLAKRLRRLQIPTLLYVCPTVWAWREGRVKLLRRDLDQVLCIYPFEEGYLRERGVNATFVGNPLLDDEAAGEAPPALPAGATGALRLALMPGSRATEVQRLLRPMLEAVQIWMAQRPVELAIPVASTVGTAAIAAELQRAGLSAQLVPDGTRAVLSWAQVALVKSGTVTLETALAGVPMAVVYKMSPVTALIARAMLRIQFVSLPNLLLDRPLVPELLQGAATPAAMAAALEEVLTRRDELQAGYREVRAKLGGAGAAARVAAAVLGAARERSRGASASAGDATP
jgi:lipid-A-disaccharide synthase